MESKGGECVTGRRGDGPTADDRGGGGERGSQHSEYSEEKKYESRGQTWSSGDIRDIASCFVIS